MKAREVRTTKPGIYALHKRACALGTIEDRALLEPAAWPRHCTCEPVFRGSVYDRATRRTYRTETFPGIRAAVGARNDLIAALGAGKTPEKKRGDGGMTFGTARREFVEAAFARRVLNKHGRHFRPKAIRNIESSLRNHAEHLDRRSLNSIQQRDIQAIVDGMTLSGSRIRSVVNAIRSLYAWARAREHCARGHNPAQDVVLPAVDSEPRDRVETPRGMLALLDALPLADAVPLAIAAYASARRDEIRYLRWVNVDLNGGYLYLGEDPEARKSVSAQRAVPIIPALRAILVRWRAVSDDTAPTALVVPGIYEGSRTGLLSIEAWQIRVDERWADAGLVRLTLHEARHSFATWCDAAGITERVVSVLMGHSMARANGGAAVTRRYQHLLPDDLELAGQKLGAYVVAHLTRPPTPKNQADDSRPRLRLVS